MSYRYVHIHADTRPYLYPHVHICDSDNRKSSTTVDVLEDPTLVESKGVFAESYGHGSWVLGFMCVDFGGLAQGGA